MPQVYYCMTLCSWLLETEFEAVLMQPCFGLANGLRSHNSHWHTAMVWLQLPFNSKLMQATKIGGVSSTSRKQKKTATMQTLRQIPGQDFIIQVQALHISTAEHNNLLLCECIWEGKWVWYAFAHENTGKSFRKRDGGGHMTCKWKCLQLFKKQVCNMWCGVYVCGKVCKGSLATYCHAY